MCSIIIKIIYTVSDFLKHLISWFRIINHLFFFKYLIQKRKHMHIRVWHVVPKLQLPVKVFPQQSYNKKSNTVLHCVLCQAITRVGSSPCYDWLQLFLHTIIGVVCTHQMCRCLRPSWYRKKTRMWQTKRNWYICDCGGGGGCSCAYFTFPLFTVYFVL